MWQSWTQQFTSDLQKPCWSSGNSSRITTLAPCWDMWFTPSKHRTRTWQCTTAETPVAAMGESDVCSLIQQNFAKWIQIEGDRRDFAQGLWASPVYLRVYFVACKTIFHFLNKRFTLFLEKYYLQGLVLLFYIVTYFTDDMIWQVESWWRVSARAAGEGGRGASGDAAHSDPAAAVHSVRLLREDVHHRHGEGGGAEQDPVLPHLSRQ